MILVESVVSFTIERLADLLIEEASLLHGVSGQIKKLQTELKKMQCFLRDAERKQNEPGESIKNWISEIRKLSYDVEDVMRFGREFYFRLLVLLRKKRGMRLGR